MRLISHYLKLLHIQVACGYIYRQAYSLALLDALFLVSKVLDRTMRGM